MKHTIESERAKYDREYLGADPDGHFTKHHGMPLKSFLAEGPFSFWLDIGCGSGSFVREVVHEFHPSMVVGVDISKWAFGDAHDSCICVVAPAHKIPIIGDSFDTITACDLLEHLPPEWVIPTLEEIKRLAWVEGCQIGLTIASRPWKDLHLTVQPREWWLDRIAEVFGDVEVMGEGEVYFRVNE